MEQYISKSALVSEFNRLIAELVEEGEGTMFEQGRISAFEDAKLFLDTLEVKELPILEKVSPDTGQTTLYKDGDKSYLERFGYRIDLKELDKLPKKNLKAQKGE